MTTCPCGSGRALEACCGPILDGAPAPTAEALMRSRYSAFCLRRFEHVERTHAPEAQGDFDRAAIERDAETVEWTGLSILDCVAGGPDDTAGEVEFEANFRQNGMPMVLHERSTFRREGGQWLYVDGTVTTRGKPVRVDKVGRNAPCPCGSGRKFKKCCGA